MLTHRIIFEVNLRFISTTGVVFSLANVGPWVSISNHRQTVKPSMPYAQSRPLHIDERHKHSCWPWRLHQHIHWHNNFVQRSVTNITYLNILHVFISILLLTLNASFKNSFNSIILNIFELIVLLINNKKMD